MRTYSIEKECSYVLDSIDIDTISKFLNCPIYEDIGEIEDFYLEKQTRVRSIKNPSGKIKYFLTHKIGEKSHGERKETETEITENQFFLLKNLSKLNVKKHRYKLQDQMPPYLDHSVYVDVVDQPLKISILEIEYYSDRTLTPELLFNKSLSPCPLSAYCFFKRKIGICGSPSSGKTETARYLNRKINIDLDGNSQYVPEYCTHFIQDVEDVPEFADTFLIFNEQKKHEHMAWKTSDIIVSDSPTFLAYIYLGMYQDISSWKRKSIHMCKLYEQVLEDIDSYSQIIYLKPSEYKENNIRYKDKHRISYIDNLIQNFMDHHNIDYWSGYKREDVDLMINGLFYINKVV